MIRWGYVQIYSLVAQELPKAMTDIAPVLGADDRN